MRNGLTNLGFYPEEEELAEWFKETATQGGAITFKNWCEMMLRKIQAAEATEELLVTFKYLDKDNNGTVDREEFITAMHGMAQGEDDGAGNMMMQMVAGLSEDDIGALFDQADIN